MANRLTPTRLLSNALHREYDFPKWIKRKSMNDRLNYIVNMYSETCGDNWYLWIETAVETLPMLIYALFAVSNVDVVKGILEEDYKCGIRQRSEKSKRAARSAAARAKNFFWKVEGVRAKLFWYWLIIEVVTEYVANWQSIVIQEQRCEHPPHAGPCILDSPGSTLGSIIGSTTLFWTVAEYDPSHWSFLPSPSAPIAPGAPGQYNVGASAQCVWGSDNNITWHLDIIDGLGHVVCASGSVTSKASSPSSASCFGVSDALSSGQAGYEARVVVTASPGATFGHCVSGTFSVGVKQ